MSRIVTYVLLISAVLISCQEPIDFESPEVPVLVVDGKVSTQLGASHVTIYTSVQDQFIGAGGYSVILFDDLGTMIPFETSGIAGFYVPTDPGFRGQIGRGYRMEAITPESALISSEMDTIMAPSQFDLIINDTLYVTVQADNNARGANIEIRPQREQYQSRFTFHYSYWDPFLGDSLFVRRKDAFELYQCDGADACDVKVRKTLEVVPRRNWSFGGVVQENHITNFTVTQETLSPRSYRFWRDVELLLSNDGLVFDTFPFPIDGNVSCDGCSFEVIGQFQAVSFTQKNQNVSL